MCIDAVLIQVATLVSNQLKLSDHFPNYSHLVMSNHHLEMVLHQYYSDLQNNNIYFKVSIIGNIL